MPSEAASHFPHAHRHLMRRDERLRPVIKRVGPCTLQTSPNAFRVLAASIVSQQISSKAAESISNRVRKLCGRGGIRPNRLVELKDEDLRAAGLSASKVLSMRSLTEYFLDHPKLIRGLGKMPDDEVIEALIPIRGIGVWTAQMFLIFCLGRPDVLPTADFGLKSGVRDLYGLDELPKADVIEKFAEPWQPFRTVATWYMWRSRGPVPQSKGD